ncbi:transcriptional regulator with XRE-family HTH domain [Paucibacter oligotrophus]|uniref:Transcriptional regulator with XRE-family HTH domain n=1 Tax=Roseateles oligotrophus TaxID=1769250 RepID=A0A840LAA6_9BURK|nr:helix-turn-helix transcriptional regulator [Roseateles oligotrophus]MBB4844681.1 transcriptional regulator with XRE-family HTH domain [Roseateles oligotrophus]
MINQITTTSVLERQLLLQLGDRLKQHRKARRMGTVEMCERAGISRMTLAAIEGGSPSPSLGNYVRVMSVLGLSAELALLAGDTLQPAPAGSAAARSTRERPEVSIQVRAGHGGRSIQELQSLVLHEAAVQAIERDPALLGKAKATLDVWMGQAPESRSMSLWMEWQTILDHRRFKRVLGWTQRAKELRQASPLVTILTDSERQSVLSQVRGLKAGVVLGNPGGFGDEPMAGQP